MGIILSNSTRMPKGRQKKADTASRRHRAKKKEQRRGGTKEDRSLRGTTTKLVRVIPVIKAKHQSKRTQDNVRSPRVATATRRRDKHRRQNEEKEESKIEQKNHTTSTTTRTTAASKQRSTDGTVWDTF